MNAAAYRRLRIAVGSLTLGFCALAFADVGNWISAPVARAALWPQFAPSLLSLLKGGGWMAAGCVAVILLTLLFGRVYCAMLCPLGVLMDLTAKLAKRTGKKRKLPYRKGKAWLRATVVAVCAAGLVAGITLPLVFLDPYSLFGKITAATVRPLLGWANHAIAATGIIHPVDVSPVSWITAGVALALLLLVVVSAIFRGRLWCNTACPVGAVLGFFSKHALFRLKIAETACVGCSMCERVCPAQCIDNVLVVLRLGDVVAQRPRQSRRGLHRASLCARGCRKITPQQASASGRVVRCQVLRHQIRTASHCGLIGLASFGNAWRIRCKQVCSTGQLTGINAKR